MDPPDGRFSVKYDCDVIIDQTQNQNSETEPPQTPLTQPSSHYLSNNHFRK